ncbi:MAG: SOS response-associated peptidase [Candidatus Hodarchaeales archaeon]
MCGRFVFYRILESIKERFGIKDIRYHYNPSYNIAPTQEIAIIDSENILQPSRWGMISPKTVGKPIINARCETVMEKKSFRPALEQRRCLIPADGYYEWRKDGKKKTPFYFGLKKDEPFAFAGLYEPWESNDGESKLTSAIITTEANEIGKPVHGRMPVILKPENESDWLDPETDLKKLVDFLKPYPSEEMQVYEVSPKVNSFKYNSPDCIKQVVRKSLLDFI